MCTLGTYKNSSENKEDIEEHSMLNRKRTSSENGDSYNLMSA